MPGVERQNSPRGLAPDGGRIDGADGGDRWVLRAFDLYVRALAGAMPGRLALAVTLSILGALTEGLGLLTLVPLLQLIGIDVQQGSVGYVARSMAAAFGRLGLPLNLVSILLLYVGLIAADAGLRRWQTATYCTIQVGFTAYLRKRLHQVVTRASWVQ